MATYKPDRQGLEKYSRHAPKLQGAIRSRTETGVRMAKSDAPRDSGEYASGIVAQYGEERFSGMTRFAGYIVATAPHSAAVEYPSRTGRGDYVLTRVAERLTAPKRGI